MLELLMGLNRGRRHDCLMNRISTAMQDGKTNMYLLTPEQTTFVFQRELVRRFGPEVALHIEVIDIPAIAERVFDRFGGRKKMADSASKLLFMSIIVDIERKNLKSFNNISQKPEFIGKLIDAMETFAKEGQTPDDMRTAADAVREENPALADKLDDMATLTAAYLGLVESAGMTAEDILQLLVRMLNTTSFLDGSTWFVDGFTDFSGGQKRCVETIMSKADSVVMTLPCAGTLDESTSSKSAVETAKWAFEFCASAHIPTQATRTGDASSESPALSYVQANLCDSRPAVPAKGIENASNSVRLFADNSLWGECVHVASAIMRAVRNGYRYREMSLVLCDYERYAPVLESVFARYDIPLYLSSRKEEIAKKPVMLAVNAALDSATKGMAKEDVLAYLKAGLSNLNQEEVALLENYVLTWNIRGGAWEPAGGNWTMHPDGFGMMATDESNERLSVLNELRERGVGPLLRLKAALKHSDTLAEYVAALHSFLDEIDFIEKLQGIVDTLSAQGNMQTAQEYAQVFDVLDSAMSRMSDIAGDIKRTANDFVKLFRMLCGTYRIMTVPPLLDQVSAYTVGDARFFCSKVRFFLGADDRSIPQYSAGEGLFSADDAVALAETGTRIPGAPDDDIARMMSEISLAVSGAKRMLVFTYNTQGDRGPSPLYLRISQMFPGLQREQGAGEDGVYAADLMHPVQAGALMGKLSMNSAYANTASALAMQGNKVLQDTAINVMDKTSWSLRDLSNKTVRGLYGESIPLSASRVDTYSACRYNFFLKFGLGLRVPNKNKLAGPVVGNMYHEVIERVCRKVEGAGGFKAVSDKEIREMTKQVVDEYTEKKMGGMNGQSERNTYLYRMMCREVTRVIRTLAVEFKNSDFVPSFFELKVGGENADMPAIEIRADKAKGVFTGRIDRVDTYSIDGRSIMRVVDYKTGNSRLFSLTDILTGKGTQLLVYNQAVLKDGLPGGATPETAGILYTPAKHPAVALKSKTEADKVGREREKMLKRDGILVSDRAILEAMEHPDAETHLLPFKVSAKGEISGSVCSAEQMADLNAFADVVLQDTLRGINGGDISANPISRGQKRTSCEFCPHRAACHKDSCGTRYRYVAELGKDEAFDEIHKRVEDAGKKK